MSVQQKLIFAFVGVSAILSIPCFAQPKHWTGDGGAGKSVAILAPRTKGLAESQGHIPIALQAGLVSTFTEFSAMKILDRQNLEEHYVELDNPLYSDDSEEMDDLGNLKRTAYVMSGRVTKTVSGYMLQLTVTKTAKNDKTTVASYVGNFTPHDLENQVAVRRASLDLLPKMGVALTPSARAALSGAGAR